VPLRITLLTAGLGLGDEFHDSSGTGGSAEGDAYPNTNQITKNAAVLLACLALVYDRENLAAIFQANTKLVAVKMSNDFAKRLARFNRCFVQINCPNFGISLRRLSRLTLRFASGITGRRRGAPWSA
jgi:hypothetical protein